MGYGTRERDSHKKERRCFRSHAALLLTELRQLLCPILPLAQALNLLGPAALSASAGKAAGGERAVNALLVSDCGWMGFVALTPLLFLSVPPCSSLPAPEEL